MTEYLHITAHGRDLNNITHEKDFEEILELEGYVPFNLGIGGGDDVEITVDIDTGQIVGWDAVKVRARLAELKENPDS